MMKPGKGAFAPIEEDNEESFEDWLLASEWHGKLGCRLFPTPGSWSWFERQHREELLRTNALMVIRGRKHVHRHRIEPACLRILRRDQQVALATG